MVGPVVLIPELCYLTGMVAVVFSCQSNCQAMLLTVTGILTASIINMLLWWWWWFFLLGDSGPQ